MFKTSAFVINTAVAENGTFTVSYPTNRDASFYRNTAGHKIVDSVNNVYNWPEDFTLSFGTSSITVTWANARTLAVGVAGWLELNEQGDNERRADAGANADNAQYRGKVSQTMLINLGAPDTADADGYFASQDLTAAGVASTSGTAALAIAAAALAGTADVPRNVVAAWTGTAVLTVTGTDEFGATLVESSASGTTFTGKKAFKTVTGISVSANVTSLTVGTGVVLGLPVYVPSAANILAELQDGVLLAADRDKIHIPVQINETDLLAGTAQQFVAPAAGYITGLQGVCQKAVTTGGAVTVEANTVAVVGLSITLADSDAAGTTYTDTVKKIATGLVAKGDDCTITPAAAINTAGALNCNVILEPIYTPNGTFVAAVTTEPSATTGDVRGTYSPIETPNGSLEFSLLVSVPDPTFRGLTQYAG